MRSVTQLNTAVALTDFSFSPQWGVPAGMCMFEVKVQCNAIVIWIRVAYAYFAPITHSCGVISNCQ